MKFSRIALALAAVFTGLGIASGVAWYLDHRDDAIERQVPGTEAWVPHLVITAVVLVWWVIAARRSPLGARVVFSPLLRPIASRIGATFRTSRNPLRWVAVAFLVFLQLYGCWRTGEQVFAGLDENFTRNAWGGPSYLGAMYCHYLDGALIFAICHVGLRGATVRSVDRQHQRA
ncbi:hypothetical protein [Cryptosporangium sp. NPDC048952]|uniref:hypothetical protein n=1 Tax=Cryptosporangium sp. NPDC048952 TaxID=3363961 RepID=UPI0037113AD0